MKLWNERIGKTAKMTLQRKFLAGEDVYDVFCECGAHVGEFVIEDDDISDVPTHCVHCDRRLTL